MAESKPHGPTWKLDERRKKIRELIKERIENADYILKEKQQKTGIEGRLEESDATLQDLIEFGDELVMNLKVASEVREIQRRNFEDTRIQALSDDLSKESTEAIAKLTNITDKWTELNTFKEPVVMFNQLEIQKQRIADLMASKDAIINQCQSEIDRVGDQYYADQEKQSVEIACLVERIDSQVELIKKAYNNHLELLQESIEEERLKLLQTGNEKWLELFDTMASTEEHKIQIEKEKQQFYAEELDKLYREQEEITRATRIRLEKDAEALELELCATQNNVLMNSEKLDYDYLVLQKRNEENVIINNQQKRRVAKFKENIMTLKAKIATIKGKAEVAIKKLTSDVEKLYMNIMELENKSQDFLRANEKKYRYVWNINYQEVLSLMNRIYQIDRLLFEQQLGVPWVPQHVKGIKHNPEENITIGLSPIKGNKHKSSEQEGELEDKKQVNDKPLSEQLAEARFLRSIMKKISDRCGFIIEEKLLEILEPFTEEEKCLVRVDNIFSALKLKDYSDVKALTHYFLPYSWCPNCQKAQFASVVEELLEKVDEQRPSRGRPSPTAELEKITEVSISSSSDTWSMQTNNTDQNINSILVDKSAQPKTDKTVSEESECSDHYLVIKPAFVLTALRNFTDLYLKEGSAGRLGTLDKAIVRSSKTIKPLSKHSLEKFWSNFLNIMPPEKQKLWKTLQHGLDHYLNILKEREKLDAECEFLRKQNSELKYLLQMHIPSAV